MLEQVFGGCFVQKVRVACENQMDNPTAFVWRLRLAGEIARFNEDSKIGESNPSKILRSVGDFAWGS